MARTNPYKTAILERMRILNAELALLSDILKEVNRQEKEKEEEKK